MNKTIDNIPRQDAIQLICSHLKQASQIEYVPLHAARGRVTSQDVVSKINLPDTPSSRWDGISFSYDCYIACGGDVRGWKKGVDFEFTNTGIGIFNDAFDTMVKIEDTLFEGGSLVAIRQTNVVSGQNIISKGERMAVGDVLVPKNTLIQPSHLNLMASGGNLTVPVYRKPIVALIPTGNELISCSDSPLTGQTIESNTWSMRAKVEQWGGIGLIYPIQKDNMDTIKQRLLEAATQADIIVICGGSGRGRYDLLQNAISEIGTLFFSSVEHGPGKRTCFSVIDNTPVFGLVGPPGGEEMTFDFYVIPAIRTLLHQQHLESMVSVILDDDVAPHFRVNFYFTVRIYRGEDGELHGSTLPHAQLDRNISEHNGYLYIPKSSSGYKKGDRICVELRIGYENI